MVGKLLDERRCSDYGWMGAVCVIRKVALEIFVGVYFNMWWEYGRWNWNLRSIKIDPWSEYRLSEWRHERQDLGLGLFTTLISMLNEPRWTSPDVQSKAVWAFNCFWYSKIWSSPFEGVMPTSLLVFLFLNNKYKNGRCQAHYFWWSTGREGMAVGLTWVHGVRYISSQHSFEWSSLQKEPNYRSPTDNSMAFELPQANLTGTLLEGIIYGMFKGTTARCNDRYWGQHNIRRLRVDIPGAHANSISKTCKYLVLCLFANHQRAFILPGDGCKARYQLYSWAYLIIAISSICASILSVLSRHILGTWRLPTLPTSSSKNLTHSPAACERLSTTSLHWYPTYSLYVVRLWG